MKTSLQWLSQYLSGPSDPTRFADALTHGGLPVEVIERHGDDTVIDVEVTSNRGDCLCHLGIARELAALLDRDVTPPAITLSESAPAADSLIGVRIEDSALCPYYGARIIRGVKIGPSPAWMATRLEAAGVRSINNVVDCTNYVMLELGQPTHAFDLDRFGGRQVVVRTAKPGETLVTLDGHNRKLTGDMLCICNDSRPVALAGVMGGIDSEVSAATTTILLESARFAPLTVRRTARALAMKSDAAYRFERGIDPALPPTAAARCAQLIVETAGGEVLSGIAEAGSARPPEKKLTLRLSRLAQVLGTELEPRDVEAALHRLRLRPEVRGNEIVCTIPSYRNDLNIEIDLVEEVARIVGYDKIPLRETISIRVTPPEPDRVAENHIRGQLVAAGYFEAVTFSFATDGLAEAFVPQGAALCQADPGTRKSDNKLRPSILPGLLEAVRRNESVGVTGARLFEMGCTFWHNPDGTIQQPRRLAVAAVADYREVRGVIESVLEALNATRKVVVTPSQARGFDVGSTGTLHWDGQPIGTIGEISKQVADQLDLRSRVIAAELDLAPLIAGTQHVPQLTPLPRFPAVRRDLSLVVPESTRFEAIRSLVAGLNLAHLEDVEYVTTYRGKPLDKASKSVTITLVFRSPTGTLTGGEVDHEVDSVINAAKQSLGAALRA